jgi:hypothetical protein
VKPAIRSKADIAESNVILDSTPFPDGFGRAITHLFLKALHGGKRRPNNVRVEFDNPWLRLTNADDQHTAKGFGLGLSIARETVHAIERKTRVSNALDANSTPTVEYPRQSLTPQMPVS